MEIKWLPWIRTCLMIPWKIQYYMRLVHVAVIVFWTNTFNLVCELFVKFSQFFQPQMLKLIGEI